MTTKSPELAPVRTLAELFLRAERVHDRPFALKEWRGGKAELLPDWRLHRQILRVAIYLRERSGVGPGDCVAIVAPLGVRSLVLEWGALLLGATPALLAPWGAGTAEIEALGASTVFDESTSWTQALDLGGSLDTAERAQSIRSGARAIEPGAPALRYLDGANGGAAWATLSHAQAIAQVQRLRGLDARQGEVSVTASLHASLSARLALYGYVGDGRTRVAFCPDGERGSERTNGSTREQGGALT